MTPLFILIIGLLLAAIGLIVIWFTFNPDPTWKGIIFSAIFLIFGAIFAVKGILGLERDFSNKYYTELALRWNSGYCSCGGSYILVGGYAQYRSNPRYIYVCYKCGHEEIFGHAMRGN